MRLSALVFVLSLACSIYGSELSVRARNYTHSCGYFTSQRGDVELSYRDTTLPWGTSISVVTGWEGREGFPEKRFTWKDREELSAQATAPYTWTLKLSKVLHERTEACLRDSLNFVLKISVPGSQPRYENGGSPWGYYRIRLLEFGMGQCVSSDTDLPEFRPFTVETVERF